VLKDNGSVAWVGEAFPFNFSHATLPHITRLAVACDSRGRRVLDHGAGINLKSLALHGSKLTWVDAGVTHSAMLH
jgi:hypothetical protein